MESVEVSTDKRPWPELILLAGGVLFILLMMVRSSSGSCHHWKAEMTHVSGAFLAAAGEEEYPQPETGVEEERTVLRDAARRIIDERPFMCL